MNSKNIKNTAKRLKEISQKYGYEIKHCHALEILSQMENNTNWHVSSKEPLTTGEEAETNEKPLSKLLENPKKGQVTILSSGYRQNSEIEPFTSRLMSKYISDGKEILLVGENAIKIQDAIISNLLGFPVKDELRLKLFRSKKEVEKIKVLVGESFRYWPGRDLSLFRNEFFLNRSENAIKEFKALSEKYKFDIIVITIFPENFFYPPKQKDMTPKVMERAFKEMNEAAKALDIPIVVSVNANGGTDAPTWGRFKELLPASNVIKIEENTLKSRTLEQEETVEELE